MKRKIAAILALNASLAGTALAFKADFFGGLSRGGNPVHEEITREALSDIKVFFDDGASATLDRDFINALIEENTENDELGLDDGRLHFDDSRLRESARFVWDARQAAVSGFFNGGSGGTLDGGVIQTNLGSAMHAIQDFFAHSTWTEINASVHERYGPLKGPLLPLPRIGLSETPFTEGIFTTITKLDVVLFAGTNEEVACDYSSTVSPALLLTSAYYDFQMSDMINGRQLTIDHGFYTDGWVGLDSTQLTFGGTFRESSGLPIKWPKGRCVHGGDGPDAKGINKDKSDRPGYWEARKAAVQATRAFMLNFLAGANVLATANKEFACRQFLECKDDGSNDVSKPSGFSVTKAESPTGFGDWSDKVLKITSSKKWPSRMLSYTLDGVACDVYRPWRKDDNADGDHDTINCSSNKQGPLELKIFQTARPQNVLQTLSYTVNEVPMATVTGIQPQTAGVGVPTTFNITGNNLPSFPITLLGGKLCSAATNPRPTGYSVSCTPSGDLGNQQIIIRVDGGISRIIDSSQSIHVVASPPTNQTGVFKIISGNFYAVHQDPNDTSSYSIGNSELKNSGLIDKYHRAYIVVGNTLLQPVDGLTIEYDVGRACHTGWRFSTHPQQLDGLSDLNFDGATISRKPTISNIDIARPSPAGHYAIRLVKDGGDSSIYRYSISSPHSATAETGTFDFGTPISFLGIDFLFKGLIINQYLDQNCQISNLMISNSQGMLF